MIGMSRFRRFIPALVVSSAVAFAYFGPTPVHGFTLSADSQPGYGFYGGNDGNNCGRFGYGTHDHDKTCMNRPFPGNPAPGTH